MNIKYIKYKTIFALCAVSLIWLSGCVDERFQMETEVYNPADDPEMVCLPFNINLGVTATTRDGDKATDETEPGFVDGSANDHKIDFETPHECFAIFFGEDKKVKYIKDLYLVDQLGSGGKVEGTYPEFSVPVVCYIPKSDCTETKLSDGSSEWTPKLLNVLVVLNGGPIYNKISKEIYNDDGSVKNKSISDILSIKWKNPASYSGDDQYKWNEDADDSDGRIGFNSNELFTMTNSAYWKKNSDGTYKLMTATPIEGKAYSSIQDYLKKGSQPTSTVYVERMVAKFSAPTFQTEVIGSDRVFRPDQNAMAMVIYSWEDNNLVSSPRSWRIHLLGWAINGDESESYIFKNIGNVGLSSSFDLEEIDEKYITNPRWPGWNDEGNFRTYWSMDPHYDDSGNGYADDFYPWQFRKAADRTDIISVQGGLSQKGGSLRTPVLRYNSFNDVLNQWSWRSILHVQENTFDPDGDWYDIFDANDAAEKEEDRARNPKYLDGRASYLAGPHLLIVGEVYVEDEGSEYVSAGVNFGKVENLYSDRIRRFYKDEKDWFKMFIREFNRALATQETMNFPVLDWDEKSDNKASHSYAAQPEGEPVLFFGDEPLTNILVDQLEKEGYTFSQLANVRTGDGRLIPWIEPKPGDPRSISVRLMTDGKVREDNTQRKKGDEMFYTTNNSQDDGLWNSDMYKSLFYEWFGPIDHFKNGYMYYAGDIRHRESKGDANQHDFYGTVRNHWYKFHVESINALGIPVDDPDQLIIPGSYNYNDQIIVFLDIISWHSRETIVDIE